MCGRSVCVVVCLCGFYHNDATDLRKSFFLIYSNKGTCHISKLSFFLPYLSCLTRTTAFWDARWHFCAFFSSRVRKTQVQHPDECHCFRLLLMFPTDADSGRQRELLHLAEKNTSRSNISTSTSSQCAPTGRGPTTTTQMLILCWRQPTQKKRTRLRTRVQRVLVTKSVFLFCVDH